MMFFLFAGDMLVMAFMIGVLVWVLLRSNSKHIEEAARIPLEDEAEDG